MRRIPWRLLAVAGLDTAVTLAAAAVVGGLAVVASTLGEAGAWRACSRWELAVAAEERSRAESALRDLARRLAEKGLQPREPPRLEDLEGRLWVAVCGAPARDVTPLVAESELWTGRVRLGFWPWAEGLASTARNVLRGGGTESLAAPLRDGLLWLVPTGAIVFLIAGLVLRRRRPAWEWERPRIGTGRALACGAGVGLVTAAGVAALEVVQARIGMPAQEQAWVEVLFSDGRGRWLLSMVAVALAPVGEELFFRGHLFRWLAAQGERRWAYAFSAAAFAAIHFNPSAFPSYLALGLAFAWAYERWRSPIVPIAAHAAANAVALALLLFT